MTNALPQIPSPTEPAAPQLQVLPDPKPYKKIRNGKIARLPFIERDMVNRMLRDHIPYEDIVGALAEHGIHVTERNVSNWKTRGGYKEWAAEQDRALTNRLTQDNLVEHLRKNDAGQLAEVGLQIAATNISQFFLKTQTQETLATNPASCRQPIADACRLARHIHNFQKYRDDTAKELGFKYHPERARREEERLTEITRDVYSAAKLGNGPNEPDVTPRRNFIPKEPPPAFPAPLY